MCGCYKEVGASGVGKEVNKVVGPRRMGGGGKKVGMCGGGEEVGKGIWVWVVGLKVSTPYLEYFK